MDQSFDQFGGGGWVEQGEQEFNTSQTQKTNAYDKIPIPATVEYLLSMSGDEEKYILGNYSFSTIRTMGRVVSAHTDTNQSTTYEICDAFANDPRVAKRFTVIRYGGADVQQPSMEKTYSEGQNIQAVGKIRLFNNRISLVAFHIREVTLDTIEVFKMESKLAKIYYSKNLSDQTHGLEKTIFKTAKGGQARQAQGSSAASNTSGMGAAGHPVTPNRMGGMNVRITPNPTPNRQPYNQQQQQAVPLQTQEASHQAPHNMTPQQMKILDYITRYGGQGEPGMHVDQIRQALKPMNQQMFAQDLETLQNDGKIYQTIDEEHYGLVQ